MSIKRFIVSTVFLLSLSIAAGCNVSEQDALKNAELALEQALEKEQMEGTAEGEEFTYYLPEKFTVEEEIVGSNNVVLKEQDQLYILFVNELEKEDSRVVYESTIQLYDNILVDEARLINDKFTYLVINKEQEDDEEYVVTFGIGGIKITTVTDTKRMNESVQQMVEIVSSVKHKNN